MRARRLAAGLLTAVLGAGVLSTPVSPVAASEPVAQPAPVAQAEADAACPAPAKGFKPTRMSIPAIHRTVGVVKVRRTKSGAVGTPPVTNRGKWLMGRDPQALPGAGEGTVIMAAHTWPDGSALGNALLRSLRKGDRVVLQGKGGAKVACYQISKRKSFGAKKVPRKKTYRYWGPEQLVIVVCSGKRLGPGNWARRTVWYATPVAHG